MATLSLDLRQRIIKAYDRGDVTRDEVARRFEVSLGMVKKLLRQRSQIGTIEPLHHRSGRKPVIVDTSKATRSFILPRSTASTFPSLSPCLNSPRPGRRIAPAQSSKRCRNARQSLKAARCLLPEAHGFRPHAEHQILHE